MNNNQNKYVKMRKKEKRIILFVQLSLIITFILAWELLVRFNIIDSFIYSSPYRIIKTIYELTINNNFFNHILTTIKEIIIAFVLGTTIGFIVACIMYEFKLFSKIIDPFLTMLNSLPKIALGPLFIIIFGANTKSIIIMALSINLIISILSIYSGFNETDEYQIKLFKTLKASKIQILTQLVIPSSYSFIIASCKLCIAQTLVGVIMGEFLVSKEGIGYLIVYGKQVFNLDLVMTGIILLAILSYLLYKLVGLLEITLLKYK